MHSIFTVQSPVPNATLFVRLCNLRAWLGFHAGVRDGEDAVKNVSKGCFLCQKVDLVLT